MEKLHHTKIRVKQQAASKGVEAPIWPLRTILNGLDGRVFVSLTPEHQCKVLNLCELSSFHFLIS